MRHGPHGPAPGAQGQGRVVEKENGRPRGEGIFESAAPSLMLQERGARDVVSGERDVRAVVGAADRKQPSTATLPLLHETNSF